MPKTLKQYFNACGDLAIDHTGDMNVTITKVVNDSRESVPGALFVAVNGTSRDGRRFIADAISRGATAVVYKGRRRPALNVPSFRVTNDYAALARIAECYFDNPSRGLRMIAVTGTNGKSTTTGLIQSIGIANNEKIGLIGTVHCDTGTETRTATHTTPPPLELQALLREMRGNGIESVVIEVSSHALAQHRLGSMRFDAAVFTNLSAEHLDYHPTIDDYYETKKILFTRHLKPGGHAIINSDDEFGNRLYHDLCNFEETAVPATSDQSTHSPAMHPTPTRHTHTPATHPTLESVPTHPHAPSIPKPSSHHPNPSSHGSTSTVSRRLFTFSAASEHPAHCHLLSAESTVDRSRLALLTPAGAIELNTQLIGAHNHANVMAAVSVGFAIGIPVWAIEEGVQQFAGVPGRLERLNSVDDFDVFVDYAHTDDALRKVLEALRLLCDGNLIIVFGCGGDRDKGKRQRMGKVAAEFADKIVITSDNPRTENPEDIVNDIKCGIPLATNYRTILDRRKAIEASLKSAEKSDIVLIAGKGHEDYQEVEGKRIPCSDTEICEKFLDDQDE